MDRVVYNENDPVAAQWLRNLSDAGHIASGSVDARSIVDVAPEDLRQSVQFHAFAGVGVWSYALRLAGWPDDQPVWTGSCPCQPFSQAGRRRGVADERHLWPEWLRIIREFRPPVIFGEQVASPDGRAWLDAVSLDLETLGYAVGSADLCAAGVGASHIRQRLFFVAYSMSARRSPWWSEPRSGSTPGGSRASTVAHAAGQRSTGVDSLLRSSSERSDEGSSAISETPGRGSSRTVAHASAGGRDGGQLLRPGQLESGGPSESGFWDNAEWLQCTDGKARAVEPGTFPLAHGASQRVGRLRAYGNAIVAPLAAEFVMASMEAIGG